MLYSLDIQNKILSINTMNLSITMDELVQFMEYFFGPKKKEPFLFSNNTEISNQDLDLLYINGKEVTLSSSSDDEFTFVIADKTNLVLVDELVCDNEDEYDCFDDEEEDETLYVNGIIGIGMSPVVCLVILVLLDLLVSVEF